MDPLILKRIPLVVQKTSEGGGNILRAISSEEKGEDAKSKPNKRGNKSNKDTNRQVSVMYTNESKYIKPDQTIWQAGQLAHHKQAWEQITSDRWILQIIMGVNIEFTSTPFQAIAPSENTFSKVESEAIDLELHKLLQKVVICQFPHEPGEYISQIFIRPKKDGTYRLILNLKKLNKFVRYHHFKMETIHTATDLIKGNCYMASIDLRDAYYSVPLCKEHQKYLKFSWINILYKFTCLPNGLASAPRIFTKLLKPVYATLRSHGHVSFGYIDDSYLQRDSVRECKANVDDTTELFERL